MNGTAEDLADPAKGTRPGWDRLTGYGRVDAFAAVSSVRPGKVPARGRHHRAHAVPARQPRPAGRARPRARALAHPLDARARRGRGAGQPGAPSRRAAPRAGARSGSPRSTRAGSPPAGTPCACARPTRTATAARTARSSSSMRDPPLKRGFPKRLGSSGESSPQLADLNGDGRQEIVLATSDGRVTVLSGRTGRRFRGWPRAMRAYGARGRPPPARRRCARASSARRRWATSPAVRGWRSSPPASTAACTPGPRAAAGCAGSRCGSTCAARRATAAATRRSTRARRSPTWTGTASSTSWSARPTRRSTPGTGAAGGCPAGRCSPATRRRRRGEDPLLPGRRRPRRRRLARRGGGHRRGLRQHPDHERPRVRLLGARQAAARAGRSSPRRSRPTGIPLAGEGVPMSPSLADVDGDGRDEVAVSAFTGKPELYRGDGTRMSRHGRGQPLPVARDGAARRPPPRPSRLSIGANAAFGRTSPRRARCGCSAAWSTCAWRRRRSRRRRASRSSTCWAAGTPARATGCPPSPARSRAGRS